VWGIYVFTGEVEGDSRRGEESKEIDGCPLTFLRQHQSMLQWPILTIFPVDTVSTGSQGLHKCAMPYGNAVQVVVGISEH
jgi:hypothetical protein